MRIKNAIYILFIMAASVAAAQTYTSSNKKAIKMYEKGLTALQQGNSGDALRLMEEATQEDDGFIEAHITAAELLTDLGRKAEAKSHYRTVTERNAAFWPKAWLELGNIELEEGEYEQAIKDYESSLKAEKKGSERAETAKKGIATAQFRREALAHPVEFEPKNLGGAVNSKDDEYLPALTADGETLVFTRRGPRKATTTANTKEEEDLFTAKRNGNGWEKAVRMPEPLNSTDNEGAECISQDGRIMFFTACNRQDGGGRCDIYMCVNKGGTWGKPRNLGPGVNSGAWEGQPSFSIDGKTLYFVSNRKGGYGGMDIWKSVFDNGTWSVPENLGPEVNTAGNETSPFIHYDDKTLYFASDGHIGMGGLDIFVTHKKEGGGWEKATNIGFPINTGGDESNLIVGADSRTAIYSSDREGGMGKLDLWYFEMPEATRPTVATCFKGTVTDARSGAKVGADIKVVDLKSGEVVANTSSDTKSGEYIVSLPSERDYAFVASAEGYLFWSQNQTWDHEKQRQGDWEAEKVDIALEPIVAGSRIALRNVFFETGKWEILPASEYELGKVVELLEKNPGLKIEIGGHTDNVGQAAANQRLSEQRALAVRNYLVGKGVKEERLSHKGYGETQPVATNDTEEGRALNRRTEMKVM